MSRRSSGNASRPGTTTGCSCNRSRSRCSTHLRALAPDRPRGLLVERLDADPLARCRELGAAAYNPPFRDVLGRPHVVADLRAAGITVAVWTCDDPAGWASLTDAGVDAIITNTPADLLAWQAS